MLVLHVLTSLICPFLTLCGGIFAGTCVTLDVPQLPVHVMRWALLFSFWWSGQDSHCCRSYVRHINMTSSDCLLPNFWRLASLPVWLTACTPCTALRSQEQQKRFSPCCLLSPPPPPLFPPPPSLWRRHTHVSQSHVTFYCGISDCWYVLGRYPNYPTLTVFWPLNNTVKTLRWWNTFAGRNGLTSPLLRVVHCYVKNGMNFRHTFLWQTWSTPYKS